MKPVLDVYEGGREALEREIVNDLFRPEPLTQALRERVRRFGQPVGHRSVVPAQTLPLKVLDGGQEELRRKKVLLFSSPEVFGHEEFEALCNACGLGLADVEPLIGRCPKLS